MMAVQSLERMNFVPSREVHKSFINKTHMATGAEESSLGRIIKQIRLESGLSHKAFAKLCVYPEGSENVGKAIGGKTIYYIESGKTAAPGGAVISAIATNPYVKEKYTYQQLLAIVNKIKPDYDPVSTAEDILELTEKLPITEQVELVVKLMEKFPREYRKMLVFKIIDNIDKS